MGSWRKIRGLGVPYGVIAVREGSCPRTGYVTAATTLDATKGFKVWLRHGQQAGAGAFLRASGGSAKGKMKRCVSVQGQEASVALVHLDCPMAINWPVAGLLEIGDVLLVLH